MYRARTIVPWLCLPLLLSVVAGLHGQEVESPVQMLKGHEGSVMSVAFSPGGETLASGSRDRTIKLWDLRAPLPRTLRVHGADVYSVAFSPDGKVLASGSGDKRVRLCDVATGALRRTLTGHEQVVRAVAFSPDGKILASGSEDETLRLWDAATGTLLRTMPGHALKALAFSPDGRTLVSGGRDHTVQLWDVSTGKQRALLQGHSGCIEGVAFAPDGKTAASSSEDGTVHLWDVARAAVRQVLRGHGMEVDSVAFSPDGSLVASGSKDRTVRLWDARTGTLRQTLTGALARHESLAFSADGKTLASGSGGPEALIRLWRLDERVQRFDTDPQWDGSHHRAAAPGPQTVRQDFGYSKTHHASSTAGEIGGFLSPAAEPAYYAKKIPARTFADTLTASGTLACNGNGAHALIAFFNAGTLNEWRTPNTIALRISCRGDVFFAWVEYATGRWRAGGDEPRGFPTRLDPTTRRKVLVGFTARGAVHRWSLRYDPHGNGGAGVVTATLDDQTAVCHLSDGHKADGAAFNRFGLLSVMKSAKQGSELWLGDVTINGHKEDLRTDPGWDAMNNRRTYRTSNVRPRFDFGFSPTRYAHGRGEGELGGLIFRGDCRYPERMAYYADRLQPLDLSKPLRASGKVSLRRGVTDSTVLLGFFHSRDSMTVHASQASGLPRDFLGIVVDGPSREGFYFAPAYRLHDGAGGHAGDDHRPPHIYPDGKACDWTLEYSPTAAGGKGRITLTLDRQPVVLDLQAGHRQAGAHFDRFGLVTTWVDGNGQHIYFDDLTYTCAQ